MKFKINFSGYHRYCYCQCMGPLHHSTLDYYSYDQQNGVFFKKLNLTYFDFCFPVLIVFIFLVQKCFETKNPNSYC